MIGQSSLTKLNTLKDPSGTLRGYGNYIPKRGQGTMAIAKYNPAYWK
jgi:hypothetical protein